MWRTAPLVRAQPFKLPRRPLQPSFAHRTPGSHLQRSRLTVCLFAVPFGGRLFSSEKSGPAADAVAQGKAAAEAASGGAPPVDVSSAIESLERFTQTAPVPSGGMFDWFQPAHWSAEVLEQIHLATGSPWWLTIALTTFSLRLLLFPLGVKAARHSAKVHELQPQMTALQAEMMKAKDSGDAERQKRVTEQYVELLAKANPFKTLLYIIPQAPIFICMFLALKELAMTQPDFHTGGILWFTDLAAADPYMRLPLLASLGFIVAFEVGADAGTPAGDPRKKTMRYIMYPMMLAVAYGTSSFPQAVHLYWLVSSLLGVVQVALFRVPAVQKALELPPRRPHDAVPLPALPTNVVYQQPTPERVTLNPKKLSKKHSDRLNQ